MRRVIAVAVAIALAITSGGWRTHVITNRPGGLLVDHVAEFHGWNTRHDRVVIDGACNSACTILLGIVDNICTTKRGMFGFHSAMVWPNKQLFHIGLGGQYSEEGTRVLWFFYPKRVRAALAAHGWPEPSDHPDLIQVPATEVLPICATK